jgi:hypothetical protein
MACGPRIAPCQTKLLYHTLPIIEPQNLDNIGNLDNLIALSGAYYHVVIIPSTTVTTRHGGDGCFINLKRFSTPGAGIEFLKPRSCLQSIRHLYRSRAVV